MKNWKTLRLGDILTESKIESKNPNTQKRIRVKLNVGGVEKRPDINEKDGATKYFIRKAGQFIYGRQNLHKGAFGIIPDELDLFESSSDLPAFDIDKSCLPDWIFYFFKQGNFYLQLEAIAKGVGSKRINPTQILDLTIKLPSLKDQKRILGIVMELEEQALKLSKESDYQIEIIQKLKKAILQEAVEGKLTETWRDKNAQKITIDSILKDFRLEKAKLISERKIPKETITATMEKKDFPYNLPNTWTWAKLVNIVYSVEAGKSPQCENRPAEKNEWGVLKTTAVQPLKFYEFENKALPNNIIPDSKIEVKKGDVLITRAGPKNRVGVVCSVGEIRGKLLLSDKIIRLKIPSELVNPNYLSIALTTGASSEFWETKKFGMAESQVNISQSNIKQTPVAIMPISEQIEIVKKVTSAFKLYQDIEENIINAKRNLDLFIKSNLQETFGTNNNIVFPVSIIKKTKLDSLDIKKKANYTNIKMEFEELLRNNKQLSAIDLWKMSKYQDDIDKFYEALKLEIEVNLTIKESSEKGFLELV